MSTTLPISAPTVRSVTPVGARLGAAALVIGAAGNTLQAVLGQVLGGRPDEVADQITLANERTGLVAALVLSGTLAVPFMAAGFVIAARLLARQARRTAIVAGVLLVVGMWGFQIVQASETIGLAALLDVDGRAAATWMDGLHEQPLLLVFGLPFLIGTPLGMILLSIGMLATTAVPRWIGAAWLLFIVLDFGVGAVGPVDPHWLYLAGAIGLAAHLLRDHARVWRNA